MKKARKRRALRRDRELDLVLEPDLAGVHLGAHALGGGSAREAAERDQYGQGPEEQ